MVRNGDGKPGDGAPDANYLVVPCDALDRIIVQLTVVQGNVQIARRRIGRGQASESDNLDQLLARMEDGTRAMAAEIRTILGGTSNLREDTAQD